MFEQEAPGPADGRSTPTARALRILALLRYGGAVPAAALARRLGVTARTVRRDVARLRGLGYRIGADGEGYRLSAAERLPLRLAPEHVEAVALGLRLAASAGIEGLARDAEAAAAVLRERLPAETAAGIDRIAASLAVVPSGDPIVPGGLPGELGEAIVRRRRIRFVYRDGAGDESERSAEPYRTVHFAGRWYLLAYDLDRRDWRTFRIDRMGRLHRTTFAFSPREEPDAVEHVRRAVLRAPYPVLVRLRLGLPAEELRDRVPPLAGEIRAVDADSCEFVAGVADPGDAVPHLAALDCEILAVEPPELAERLRETGRRLARIPGAAETGE